MSGACWRMRSSCRRQRRKQGPAPHCARQLPTPRRRRGLTARPTRASEDTAAPHGRWRAGGGSRQVSHQSSAAGEPTKSRTATPTFTSVCLARIAVASSRCWKSASARCAGCPFVDGRLRIPGIQAGRIVAIVARFLPECDDLRRSTFNPSTQFDDEDRIVTFLCDFDRSDPRSTG